MIHGSPPVGSGVLVATPSLHEQSRAACTKRFRDASDVLAVTYDRPVEQLLEDVPDRTRPGNVSVVNVGSTMQSAVTVDAAPRQSVGQAVPDPIDLDAIRNEIASSLDAQSTTNPVVVFDSVTAMLSHVTLDDAVTALDALLDALAAADAVGYFYLETREHDDATAAALSSLFDATVTLHEDDGWTMRQIEHTTPEQSVDALFDVLASDQRRHALQYLFDEPTPVSESELAGAVARAETTDAGPERHQKRHTALYQAHLPKLAALGLVDHDRDAGTVTLGDNANCLRPFLALADE